MTEVRTDDAAHDRRYQALRAAGADGSRRCAARSVEDRSAETQEVLRTAPLGCRVQRVQFVAPVSAETARQIERYVADYGETVCELPDETWATSVAQWTGSHWDVLVDLWTVESGRSDMVLDARVFETHDGFSMEIHLVYVP